MSNKLVETMIALGVLLLLALAVAFGFQTLAGSGAVKSVKGIFVEDLDDVAPGPSAPKSVSPTLWFTSDDYPAEALRNGWQGTTAMRFTIDRSGRVRDCRIERSSGHPVLDEASCALLAGRGRFEPARDAQGHRIEATSQRRVTWRLPE